MKKLMSIFAALLFASAILVGCGQSDEALKSELEGKSFGHWKTVTVEFKVGGKYEAYLSTSDAAWDKHSMGEGKWAVKEGKITLSTNDSQSESVRKVKGVYTYNGKYIESDTHILHD